MWFEGYLSYDDSTGAYTGIIPMIAGYYYIPGGPGTHWDDEDNRWETPDGRAAVGGFDVYAKAGATAYMDQNNDGDFDDEDEQETIDEYHNAYHQGGVWGGWWQPNVPDWQNYDLELTATSWSVNGFRSSSPPNMAVFAGPIDWNTMVATETGANWNPTWSWGEEDIPLEYGAFKVDIEPLGGGEYLVSLTPVPEPLTMFGVFMGLLGVAGYIRKRRRA